MQNIIYILALMIMSGDRHKLKQMSNDQAVTNISDVSHYIMSSIFCNKKMSAIERGKRKLCLSCNLVLVNIYFRMQIVI